VPRDRGIVSGVKISETREAEVAEAMTISNEALDATRD